MPSLTFPTGIPALGLETILYLPTVANPQAVTVAETNATGAILLSCAIRMFEATAEQSKTKKYRLCSKQGFDALGRTDWSIARLMFVTDPQALPTSTAYPHKALVEGTRGYILRRQGFDSSPGTFVPLAATQLYDLFPVQFGVDVPTGVAPEEEGQEFEYGQEIAVTGPRAKGAFVTAA